MFGVFATFLALSALVFASALSNNLPAHLQVKIASSITKGERRNEERQAAPRNVCGGCLRPEVLCLCDSKPPTKFQTKTTILVLQHPNEFRKKTFSTVPLMSLVLENVTVKVGYNFEPIDLPLVKNFLSKGKRPLLLYPSDTAVSLETVDFCSNADSDCGSSTIGINRHDENLLVVLDGTWAEAKRMATQSPELLSACQHVAFSNSKESLYDPVRKEPEEHCLSTLEACAEALELLEDAREEADSLRHILQSMVTRKLSMEKHRNDEPRQKGKTARLFGKNQRRRQVQGALFQGVQSKQLDEETILRQLEPRDAPLVNKNWYHPTRASLGVIEQRIEQSQACLGIEVDGALVGHILHAADGSLGMLHVDESHNGKGLERILIREAASILKDLGKPRLTFIKCGDSDLEKLFTDEGWELVRGHENRTGQRKWVFS